MSEDRLAEALTRASTTGRAKVVVVGQGYVGLPVAMRAAELGFRVVGLRRRRRRGRRALRAGDSYVEDVPDEQLAAALARGYRPTRDPRDVRGFDVAVITRARRRCATGAPTSPTSKPRARPRSPVLERGALVILESTTYPGTTEELLRPILEASPASRRGVDFFLGYSPERIDPGNPTWTFVNTPKVVSGIDAASLRGVEAFYGALVDKVVPVGSTAEAELVKLLENTFRHVNIALVNELAMFATRPRRRHLVGHRRRRHQAVRVHAVHARARRRRPLPADRPVVPRRGGCGAASGRRSASSSSPTTSTSTCPTTSSPRIDHAAQPGGPVREGQPDPRCSGSPTRRERPTGASRRRCAVAERLLALGADVRGHDAAHPPGRRPRPRHPARSTATRKSSQAADLVILLVDHPDLPLRRRSAATPACSSTPRGACARSSSPARCSERDGVQPYRRRGSPPETALEQCVGEELRRPVEVAERPVCAPERRGSGHTTVHARASGTRLGPLGALQEPVAPGRGSGSGLTAWIRAQQSASCADPVTHEKVAAGPHPGVKRATTSSPRRGSTSVAHASWRLRHARRAVSKLASRPGRVKAVSSRPSMVYAIVCV